MNIRILLALAAPFCLTGCEMLRSLVTDTNGGSPLQHAAEAASPWLGPYGLVATAAATAATVIFGPKVAKVAVKPLVKKITEEVKKKS